jgi:hypothetical protein
MTRGMAQSTRSLTTFASSAVVLTMPAIALAQSTNDEVEQLKRTLLDLRARVAALEHRVEGAGSQPAPTGLSGSESAGALAGATNELRRTNGAQSTLTASAVPEAVPSTPAAQVLPANLPGGATVNYMLDGYYEYNFNHPPGRINDLRAYDVLSNAFSINQADIVFALDLNVATGRRYGVRLDLQFDQATETLPGNPANEARPEIYRNIFQAHGTYVLPVGSGFNVDLRKWASSLGVEGNFTKDQMNYTRSFYFYFLPFYHAGIRTAYHVNDKLQLNYWVVNGTNQSEPTNGFKDELFGYVLQPTKTLTWITNYYLGQDHPDSAAAANCSVPVPPGLCVAPISPAPNGNLHIFDTYATWQLRPKLTLQGEADYVIQREWANAAPGESSAPSHVDGGAAYAQYQFSRRIPVATRGEYFSDRGGLFSQAAQALKEATGTYEYKFSDGFDGFLEFRHDWSNRPYFQTSQAGSPSDHQSTAAVGVVWWYGGKQGAW